MTDCGEQTFLLTLSLSFAFGLTSVSIAKIMGKGIIGQRVVRRLLFGSEVEIETEQEAVKEQGSVARALRTLFFGNSGVSGSRLLEPPKCNHQCICCRQL